MYFYIGNSPNRVADYDVFFRNLFIISFVWVLIIIIVTVLRKRQEQEEIERKKTEQESDNNISNINNKNIKNTGNTCIVEQLPTNQVGKEIKKELMKISENAVDNSVVVIAAAVATYLGISPNDINIKSIKRQGKVKNRRSIWLK